MYKRDKKQIIILIILSFSFNPFFDLKSIKISNDILTIMSILLGFYITAISTLFGSKIIKEYGQLRDSNISYQTKLGTLLKYFKSSVYTAFFTIFFSLICSLFKGKNYLKEFHLNELASAILTSSTIVSLFLFYLLIKIFFALFYNESQKS